MAGAGLALAIALFSALLFGRLAWPLLWQDEGETAMFARRVLEYGYPKVHGERNVIYQFGFDVAQGVKERHDAYIGTTWGHFYFAAPGVALADRTADLRRKTFLMRLPFALAGAAGVALALVGVLPAVPRRGARLAVAATHFALAALCISLVLHLREVRYYALATLLASALFSVHAARHAYGRISGRAWALLTPALLFALYHTFFVGFAIFTAALALDRMAAARSAAPQDRSRRLVRDLAPLAVAVVTVVPFVVWFEQLQTARAFAERFALGPADVGRNVLLGLRYLARHEYLVPAAGLALLGSAAAHAAPDSSAPARRFLWILLALNLLANAANPLLYGRYFVALAPLGIALVLLEGIRLAPGARRRRALGLLAAAVLAAGVLPKAPDLAGRLRELREPVQGPLDFAIPFLAERYPDTRRLVIATNYESYPLMTYLGSHVVVGLGGANLARDRTLEPDVVIPRKSWRPRQDVLAEFLRRGEYQRHVLPVLDAPYNTIPELGRWPGVPVRHAFETRRPATDGQALELFLRVEGDATPRDP